MTPLLIIHIYIGSDAEENEDDLETQIAKEVAALKRLQVEKRFGR
jgi:hypothetical protein